MARGGLRVVGVDDNESGGVVVVAAEEEEEKEDGACDVWQVGERAGFDGERFSRELVVVLKPSCMGTYTCTSPRRRVHL